MSGVVVTPNRELGGNFIIKIFKFYKCYIPPNSKPSICIGFKLYFEDGACSQLIEKNVLELEKLQWTTLDYRICFDPELSPAKISRTLSCQIREALSDIPETISYRLNRTGFFRVDNEPIFCIGKEVICSASTGLKSKIELLPMGRNLDIDTGLPEEDAMGEMLNLISICPNPCRIIIVQMLVYLMRHAYVDAGKAPSFSVFLYGSTGTKKTTLSSFLTQIYNRRDGISAPSRLNASIPAAVNILMEANNEVVVLDDLFPADSRQIRRKQEETLIEITRYIGDGTVPEKMKGKVRRTGHPSCGVLFTGEYLIGDGSDAARILPVEMTKLDGVKLKYFQNRPLIVSTFYYFYISWFIENYDSIVDLLKKWLNQYRHLDLGVHDRLRETHFFLNTAYVLLLQYCYEKAILPENTLISFHKDFHKLLTQLIKKQDQRVRQKTFGGQKNFLNCIQDMYRNESLMIADTLEEFDEQIHEGVMYKNYLCLQRESLEKRFPQNTIADIVNDLVAKGALDVGKRSASKQIYDLNGKRFYFIPTKCLK